MAVRFSPGSVLQVPVGDGRSAYALMLGVRPYIAFFPDGQSDSEILGSAPLFVVAVHNSAYSRGRWGAVLRRIAPGDLPEIPLFFRQNSMNLKDCEITDAHGELRQATPEECVGMERSAVWEAEHIEERIADLYAGRVNAYVESMKVEL